MGSRVEITAAFTSGKRRPKDITDRRIEKRVRDVDAVQEERWKIERLSGWDERRRSDGSRRCALRLSTGVRCSGTDRKEERDREKQDVSVNASRAVKMTEVKSVSSVEVPEGKLMKKVSACRCQNMQNPPSDALINFTRFDLLQFWPA